MSSPRAGVVRRSMQTNPLLTKAPLGRTHPRGHRLPGPDFTYGTRSGSHNAVGVADALSGWRVQPRREDSAPPLDFVALNRDAVKSGLLTAKQQREYWAQRGGATKQGPRQSRGGASQEPPPAPDIVFGVRSRAPSPITDILSHQYAHRWLEEQLSRQPISNPAPRIQPGSVVETRTSLLRRSRPLPVTQTPFTLPQYTQVAPALDTFRDPEDRVQAFRARQVEVSSRGRSRGDGRSEDALRGKHE